ncbi:MAG: HAMP domain-containing histidine kinase [Muribaculaceae bacterium]|nr:HAMP domain-containing histidine kinase [Muribaculaceae bacterium]
MRGLYRSIRNSVEKDVMTAITDADLDELWIRLESKESSAAMKVDTTDMKNQAEILAGIDNTGTMMTESKVNGETVSAQTLQPDMNQPYYNLFSQTITNQLHSIVDNYIPSNLNIMDSVLTKRLSSRFIYPDFVAVEVIDSSGNIIQKNPRAFPRNHDEFTFCFDSLNGMSYRAYMTPLTNHILKEMAGVIVTVFLLMLSFALAFWYLFHTVSKLRSIEEMKDDFVNNMTHELKTPIAIAYSANDALLNYDTDNDPAKKETYLRIANRQLNRLRELVENILAMSMERRKTMQIKQENIQLCPLLKEIAAAQRMRSEKEIRIEVDVNDGVSVISDKDHLSNIMNNLIDNAIKYSGNCVDIKITATPEEISVSDNGIGIPQKSIPYLFNKFYRVPHGNIQDVRGYGIGLYYVKSILDKMGWIISVKSNEGKGSTFTIKFNKDGK